MTRILKDRGFVLKKKKFRETSRLITIFAENAGKLNLIAKGVRTPKSKTSAVLEPLNFIEFVYYDKPTRELQYISSADFIDDFSVIKSDLEKIRIAYLIIELVNIFAREGQANLDLFNIIQLTLTSLDQNLISDYQLLITFLIKLCEISGYTLYTGECPICHKSLNLFQEEYVFTRNYGVVCSSCGGVSNSIINLGIETKKLLASFLEGMTDKFSESDELRLKHIYLPIFDFLQHHVDEIKKIKSLELF